MPAVVSFPSLSTVQRMASQEICRLSQKLLTSESLNENVRGTKLVRAGVLLDEGSVAAGNGGLPADRGCPGDSGLCVSHRDVFDVDDGECGLGK